MITVLSPAKKLSTECGAYGKNYTHPSFLNASQTLVNQLKELDPPAIQSLMGISEKLSELNWERYQSWVDSAGPENSREAIYTFLGDTYTGLEAQSLSAEVLKPLDLIQPHRLEMGTKLASKSGKNLYEYWNHSLSQSISQELDGHSSATVINCASVEYFKSIDLPELIANVITPQFKELKNGRIRMVSFFAKKARGMMARYIIQNRIQDPNDILSFNLDRYSYNKSLSTTLSPVFTRAAA